MSASVDARRLPAVALGAGTVAGVALFAAVPAFEGYVGGVAALVDAVATVEPTAPGLAVSLGVAVLVGLSMNALPCNLPVVMSLLPATTRSESRRGFATRTALYAAGALAVLGTLGAVLGALGRTLRPVVADYGAVGPYVAAALVGGVGVLSVLWGLRELDLVALPSLPVSPTDALRGTADAADGFAEYVLLGAVYGGTGGGCPMPTYNLLLLWVVVAADPVYGAVVLGAYVFGRVLPVAAAGALLRERPQRAVGLFGDRYGDVRVVNGTLLVAAGSLLVVFVGLRTLAGVVPP